jgi:hypothetical protein
MRPINVPIEDAADKKLLHPARAVNSFVMLADQNDLRHVCDRARV